MATSSQTDKNKKEVNADISDILIIGTSNRASTTLLQQNVVTDSLPLATNGKSSLGVFGINGQGNEGKENPFSAVENGYTTIAKELDAVKVAFKLKDAESFDIPSPNDTNVFFRAVFDVNRSKAPIAMFKFEKFDTGEKDKKGKNVYELKTTRLEEPIELIKSRDINIDEVIKIVGIIGANLKNFETGQGIYTKLQTEKLLSPKTESDCYAVIGVADELMTDNDVDTLKNIFDENGLSFPEEGLSSYYNFVSSKNGLFFGKDYQSTLALSKVFNERFEQNEQDGTSRKAIKQWLRTTYLDEDTMTKKIEAETTFGVDRHNNIVIVEDTRIPYNGGGTMYDNANIKLKMSNARNLAKRLSGAIWTKLNEINPSKYTLNSGSKFDVSIATLSELEQSLIQEVKQTVEDLSKTENPTPKENEETRVDIFSKWLSQYDPIATTVENADDEEKLQKANFYIKDILSIMEESLIFNHIKKDPSVLVVNKMLTKSGDRQRIFALSGAKLDTMKINYEKGESVVTILQNVPKIQLYEKKVINLKNIQIPIANVKMNNDGKAIDIEMINGLGNWKKQEILPRVLHSILKLDPAEKETPKKLASFLNKGFDKKNDGNLNGFGLNSLKTNTENEQLSRLMNMPKVAKMVKNIQEVVYAEGQEPSYSAENLEKIKKIIRSMKEDEKLKNIYHAIELMETKEELMDTAINNTACYILKLKAPKDDEEKAKALIKKQEFIKKEMLKAINGEVSANDEDLKIEKGIHLSALITGSYIAPKVKNLQNVDTKVFEIAKNMGFKAQSVRKGKMFDSYEGTTYYSGSFYNENIKKPSFEKHLVDDVEKYFLPKKEVVAIVDELKSKSTKTVELKQFKTVKDLLKDNHKENKKEFAYDVLQAEDKEVDVGISFDAIDLGDFQVNVQDVKKDLEENQQPDDFLDKKIEEMAEKDLALLENDEYEVTPIDTRDTIFDEDITTTEDEEEDEDIDVEQRETRTNEKIAGAKLDIKI